MTLKEYNAKIDNCNSIIRETKAEKERIRKEFASECTAKYSEFVGKKVKIAYTSIWGGKTAETIGFFNGFVAGTCYPTMQVFKVRKDGTKSCKEFTSWYLPAFNDPFTIEIVE